MQTAEQRKNKKQAGRSGPSPQAPAQADQRKLSAWVPLADYKRLRLEAVNRETTVASMVRDALTARYPDLLQG